MKQYTAISFKSDLQRHFPRIVLVAAADPLYGDWVIDCLRGQLGKRHKLPENSPKINDFFQFYVGGDARAPGFANDFFTPPLFGGERVFVIKQAHDFFKALWGDFKNLTTIRAFGAQLAAAFPAETRLIVIFANAEIPETLKKSLLALEDCGVLQVKELYENQQIPFLEGLLAEAGVETEGDAFDYLLRQSTGKPHLMKLMVNRLARAQQTAGQKIRFRLEQTAELVDIAGENSVFVFIGHFLSQDWPKAWQTLENLEIEGNSYLSVISLLNTELTRLRRTQVLGAAASEDELAQQLKLPMRRSPFLTALIKKYRSGAERFSPNRIMRLSEALFNLQLEMKTGLSDPLRQQSRIKDFLIEAMRR